MDKALPRALGVLFLLVLTGLFVVGLQGALIHLLLAAGLAYVFFPLVQRLEAMRIRRELAAIAVVVLLLCAFLGLLAVLLVYLFREFRSFARVLPASTGVALARLQQLSDQLELGIHFDQKDLVPLIKDYATKLTPDMATAAAVYAQKMFSSTTDVIMSILDLYLLPVFFFYIVTGYESLVETMRSLIPRPVLPAVETFFTGADRILRDYIRGQLTLSIIRAGAYAVGLTVLRIDFGFLLGLLTGFLSIIPYVGVSLGLCCSLVIVLSKSAGLRVAIGVVALFAAVGVVEELFLRPRIIDRRSGLGELTLMLALMIGGNLFGLPGIFLAVPVAGICQVLLRQLVQSYRRSRFYLGPEAPPAPDGT